MTTANKTSRYTCRKVRDLLPLHVGGDLEARHVAPVDEHLHACLTCFREFRELATLRGRLGVVGEAPLPPGALDGFTEEVMARIALEEPGPAAELPSVARRSPTWTWMRAAAAVLVVGLLGWQLATVERADEPGAPAASLGVEAALEPSPTAEITTMAGVTPTGPWADLIGEVPVADDEASAPAPTPYPTQGALPVDAAPRGLLPSASGPIIYQLPFPKNPPAPKLRLLEGRELRLRER